MAVFFNLIPVERPESDIGYFEIDAAFIKDPVDLLAEIYELDWKEPVTSPARGFCAL